MSGGVPGKMLNLYRRIVGDFGRLVDERFRLVRSQPWQFAKRFAVTYAIVLTLGACYYFYAAARQHNAEYKYQPASYPSIPIRLKNQPKPVPYQPNCQQPRNREDADLCAQWAAVTQVTEANRLSSLSLQISVGALIFTIIGTGLLVWTLDETRQTARRELRAYVSVEMAGLEFRLADGKAFAHIMLKNGGQTPAYLCYHAGDIFVRTDMQAEYDIMHCRHNVLGRAQPFTLHMNDPQGGSLHAHDPISLEDLKEVVEGEKWLYVFGTVFYRDTFGIDRETRFCVKTDDLNLPSTDDASKWPRQKPRPVRGEWLMAHFHNDST